MKNSSKVDGLHRYMNDVTLIIGAGILGLAIVGVASFREYQNRKDRSQKTTTQCPVIGQKFATHNRVEDDKCFIQAPTGDWVNVNVE